ncbi:MAG: UDP-glucose 4-epimerase GalE [Bryobacteraceae bacterium]|jgi:UDP-glucose 4-epimerase
MSILVTGGAGYIGSVTVELLRKRGEEVVVLDDLSHGHRAALVPDVPFYQGTFGDTALVEQIVAQHAVDACIHFAALIEVGESVAEPARYFANNTAQALELLGALRKAGVARFVFSSTAAVYGQPKQIPIPEEHPQWPTNPYGWSKLFVERILESYDRAYGLKFVALRYFNASGATQEHGEHHEPESHLIPNVLKAALGLRPHVSVFGQYYPTPDGTAVRDYIHVADLGSAHMLALDYLRDGGASECINLGNGKGYSVLEVIETARRATGRAIEARKEPPRPGDPSHLVACADKARRVLGWEPASPQLEEIIRSAWEWHLAHPDGYPA